MKSYYIVTIYNLLKFISKYKINRKTIIISDIECKIFFNS